MINILWIYLYEFKINQEMQQPKSESTALKTLQSAAIHHHYLNQHSSSNQYGNKLDHSDVICKLRFFFYFIPNFFLFIKLRYYRFLI